MQFSIKINIIIILTYLIVISAPYEVFISPTGNDLNSGTEAFPLKTLTRARDQAVANKTNDGMIITLLNGTFKIGNFALSGKHSGSKAAPFIIRGKEGTSAILSGGIELKYEDSKLCDGSDIAAGIDSAYASNIRKWSFDDLGITDTSCWSIANIKKDQIPQLFCNDSLMQLAKWPDTGYTTIDSLIPTKPYTPEYTHLKGDSIGKFILKKAPLSKWEKENTHIVLGGYWFFDYLFSFELLAKVESKTGFVQLATPPSSYFGYRQGQRFYAANLLCEIKKEGRWAVDPNRRILYFWYPKYTNNQNTQIMLNGSSSINLNNANYIAFKNLTIENFINNGMLFNACSTNVIDECVIRNIGGSGIMLKNTAKTNVTNCRIYNIGRSPIWIIGGDRKNLTSSDIAIVNNQIHDFGTVKKTYKPAINLDSGAVGCRVAYNTIYNAPHSAIIFMMGNNHIIEYNHIYNVCLETQDAGVVYNGKDWTSRGTLIRNNLIENCGHGDVNAIYIDDASSGITVKGNVINNVPRGIKIGGGRDNVVESNIIIKANQWLTADNRGLNWLIPALSEGRTLNVHLTTMPYTNPVWSKTYPALLTLLDDNPGCPKGNVIQGNTIVNSGASVISPEIIQYGIVDSNISFSSNTYYPPLSKNYGVQKNLNVDTISPVPLLRMPVVPLVRNAFSNAGVLYVACVPSYHSGHVKAKAVNLRSRVVYTGKGGDTVAFSGLIAGDYVYDLWYTDIPYQDSTFSAHDTIHFSTEGSLSPKEIYPQPDNPCTLGGTSVDSATIALFWKVNTMKDVVFDSIGVWYSELGYPVKAYDSGSVKAGIWNLKTNVDTITKLKADKIYYFSIFGKDIAGTWSKTSDSAKVKIRTGKVNGTTKGNPVILERSDATLLFSDSLKIWGDELAVPYIDTIDHYDIPATNGFVISGPSFSFRNGNTPTNVHVNFDIRTNTPALPYSENDIRVYRFNINTMAWRLDTAKLTYNTIDHKLLFSTSELGLPFALMIDTMAPYLNAYVTDTAAYNVTDPIYDTFTIHDNIENPKITLLAGPGGNAFTDISYFITSPQKNGHGTYSTTIPAYVADPVSGLRGILIVSDGRSSDTVNLSRKIVRTGSNCDDKKIPAMEWTPLSVTAQPHNSALSEVFSRSLGVDTFNYDKREQRILQWLSTEPGSGSKDNWVEYSRDKPDIFKFKLGKTFWIKSKNNLAISFGTATIPALIDTFGIVLKKGEWSDFSLPFNFNIYAGDIIDATTRSGTATDGIELYEWVKSEDTYTTRAFYLPGIEEVSNPISMFKAGSVYSAYNGGERDVVLRIPPVCTSVSMIGKKSELAKSGSVSGQWSIKLGFKDDKGIELSPIYCSALPENKRARFYQAAPTFTKVCARVASRINGEEFGHAASGDLSTGGASFIISCENQSEQTSRIAATIEKITGLSQETMAVLYYKGEKHDAAQTTLCNMEIPAKEKSTGYLIVGTASYISGFIKNLNSVFSFMPFMVNRVLRIRYTLPIDVKKVTTLIFDLKGRCLDRIEITDGLHAGEGMLTVNRHFPSGYYVIQMKMETIGTTKPAVLNRRWVMVR